MKTAKLPIRAFTAISQYPILDVIPESIQLCPEILAKREMLHKVYYRKLNYLPSTKEHFKRILGAVSNILFSFVVHFCVEFELFWVDFCSFMWHFHVKFDILHSIFDFFFSCIKLFISTFGKFGCFFHTLSTFLANLKSFWLNFSWLSHFAFPWKKLKLSKFE